MRRLTIITIIMLIFITSSLYAEESQSASNYFSREGETYQVFGNLPNRGNLSDILACAGANELLWTTTLKKDPRDPKGHEAKRKAGWYSAVALWVYAVDSEAVLDAVRAAAQREPRSAVFDFALRCRNAPENWRE